MQKLKKETDNFFLTRKYVLPDAISIFTFFSYLGQQKKKPKCINKLFFLIDAAHIVDAGGDEKPVFNLERPYGGVDTGLDKCHLTTTKCVRFF